MFLSMVMKHIWISCYFFSSCRDKWSYKRNVSLWFKILVVVVVVSDKDQFYPGYRNEIMLIKLYFLNRNDVIDLSMHYKYYRKTPGNMKKKFLLDLMIKVNIRWLFTDFIFFAFIKLHYEKETKIINTIDESFLYSVIPTDFFFFFVRDLMHRF